MSSQKESKDENREVSPIQIGPVSVLVFDGPVRHGYDCFVSALDGQKGRIE
jgi:hypothetical protein